MPIAMGHDWDLGPRAMIAPVPNRFWIGTEYLLWWIKDAPLPSRSDDHDEPDFLPSPGGLGQPGTSVPFGGSPLYFGAFSGTRITAGGWLNAARTIGIEGQRVPTRTALGNLSRGFRRVRQSVHRPPDSRGHRQRHSEGGPHHLSPCPADRFLAGPSPSPVAAGFGAAK